MTHTISLLISEITITPEVNIRELDTDYVDELVQAQADYGETDWQAQWKELPKINQDNILFSGFHTITAAQRNFGDNHEVAFQVVEGNPYLLAACENASHGKRRTNADKRAAVLRWLQDDEGRTWTDAHIAKMCHVDQTTVRKQSMSLMDSIGENYDRPTKRKYIDKHGNVSWMKTEKITNAAEAKQREKDCKDVLKNTLQLQGILNKSNYDARALAEQFELTEARVRKLKDQVWNTELKKARDRWQKSYTKVRTAWMDNEALSKSVEWEAFTAVAIQQTDISFLSLETFTEADSRIKSCTDYELLQREADCLITLGYHLRNPSFWVSDLIPQAVRDEYECKELWEKIEARLPQWKERLRHDKMDVPVQNFTKDILITEFRKHLEAWNIGGIEIGKPGSPLSLPELREFYKVIREENFSIIHAVRKVLIGDTDPTEALQQAKVDHANAYAAVQKAFFENGVDAVMTDFDAYDPASKLNKFLATIVDIYTPKLRFNIFTPDEFYYDTRGDVKPEHRDVGEEYESMFRGRDLTLAEIHEETNVLHGIAKEIGWWARDDGRIPRWMDDVVKAITPPTEAEQLATVKQAFLDARDALKTAIVEAGIPEIEFLDAASNEFMGSKRNRPYRACMEPVENFEDWSVFNFTSWTESVKLLHADLENRVDWVKPLLPNQETSPAIEYVEKFKATIQSHWVMDGLVEEALWHYFQVEEAEIPDAEPEQQTQICEFFESFLDKPITEWPEFIQNQMPKRELSFVSIGISDRNYDEFEMVEFTDENSDEIQAPLEALPEELREALLKIATEKIVANGGGI